MDRSHHDSLGRRAPVGACGEGQVTFRAGDVVKHGPTGEEWVVAFCEGNDLAWCGWPEGLARTADCTMVKAADDAEHERMLHQIAKSTGMRAANAQRALESRHQ